MSKMNKNTTHDINGNPLTSEQRAKLDTERREEVTPGGKEKVTWRTDAAKSKYNSALRTISQLVEHHSWKRILDDRFDRKIAIVIVRNSEQEEWAERIGNNGLHYSVINHLAPQEGFSHAAVRGNPNDPERRTRSVVGANRDVVEKASQAFDSAPPAEKNDIVGDLLGYPDCCSSFFNDFWLQKDIRDPIYEIGCNTTGATSLDSHDDAVHLSSINPLCNVAWRYWGWTFLDHIPCAFDCEKSIAHAKKKAEWLKDSGYTEEVSLLQEWLSLPTEWSGKTGLGRVSNRHALASSSTSWYWNKKTVVLDDHPTPVEQQTGV